MFSIAAGLLFLTALLLPVYLIRRFHPLVWPMHVLALIAAAGIGLAPGTALLNSPYGTFIYLFSFIFLVVWGLGGLFAYRLRRGKHAVAAQQ
ncbi:MAG: hypothetical protein LAQ30_06135 [Acidobacteriia bacterium]|nr:hypothetical protein [Terriglobia bacterium]